MNHLCILSAAACLAAACLALDATASTNLPSAQAAIVSINPTTLQFRASGLLESNSIARVNQPVILADLTFSTNTWIEAATNVWTNSAGWEIHGTMTNGAIDCYTNALISPWITGPGLREVAVSWSNLYLLTQSIEWTTNGTNWTAVSPATDLRYAFQTYRVRVRGETSVPTPPGQTEIGILSHVVVHGHRAPSLIGATNDYAGIAIRVDNPVAGRDAVNLQTLQSELSSLQSQSSSNWSSFAAISTVNLDGHNISIDSRYALSISNDTLSLQFSGQPVWDIIGGGTVTPQIVSFSISGGTQVTMRVIGSSGWRPFPEWTEDLMGTNWTRLSTNDFASSYPALSNGVYQISFSAVTNPTAFYRAVAMDETGGSNTLSMAIRVPLSLDGPVTGVGMGQYVSRSSITGLVENIVESNILESTSVHYGAGALAFPDSVALGSGATGSTNGVAAGILSTAGWKGVAVGYHADANSESTALGSSVIVYGAQALGVGQQIRVHATNSIAIGYMVVVSNTDACAIGPFSRAYGDAAIAIGPRAAATSGGAIQIGQGTNSTSGTFQVGIYSMLDAAGKIPSDRIQGWSGAWTNITGTTTNILQFGNGIATNTLSL